MNKFASLPILTTALTLCGFAPAQATQLSVEHDLGPNQSQNFPTCWFAPTNVHVTNPSGGQTQIVIRDATTNAALEPLGEIEGGKTAHWSFAVGPNGVRVTSGTSPIHVMTDGC